MGLSCFRAISGLGWDGLDGLDLCAGLLYEHRFAMLIRNFFSCLGFSILSQVLFHPLQLIHINPLLHSGQKLSERSFG